MTLYEAFEEWVAKQPPRKHYDFVNSRECALAQFGRTFADKDDRVMGGAYSFTINNQTHLLGVPAKASMDYGVALITSKTFGQLNRALRTIREKHS